MIGIIGDEIGDSIRARGLYERDYLEVLRDCVLNRSQCAHEVALDVGANIGNHTLFLRDLFAQVIAFEPNRIARSMLLLNLELNGVDNVQVRPIGLSDRTADARLLFDPSNLGAATSSPERQIATHEIGIELVAGDEVIDQSQPVGFIKVDVEGAEGPALIGLEQTIRGHMPVLMIEQLRYVIDEATGTSPAAAFLRSIGYDIWEIRAGRAFRGNVGKLLSAVFGHAEFYLYPVPKLCKRDYPALLFTPAGYEFPAAR